MKRIREIMLTKCQVGWLCEVSVMAETDEQFTEIPVLAFAQSRWMLLALFKGIWAARQERNRVNAMYAEQREKNGWGAN